MPKKLTKHILIFSILISFVSKVSAQQWLGRTLGNYSGTYGVYTNAASIGDSKYKYYFNFWGRGVNFYNNYLLYNAPIKINNWANSNYDLQYKTPDGKADYQSNWLLETLNGKNKQFSFNQDIWGPAFMFPVSKNWNMSINTRQRTGLQMFGISESAARLAFGGKMDSTKSASIGNSFGINSQTYQELSFTLGGILAKNDRNQLTGGATVKFIRGLGAAYFKGSNMNIQGTGNNSALVNGDFQYAYTDDKSLIDPFNRPYGGFSLNSRGVGFGIDLGLSYTYRSKRAKYAPANACDRNYRKSDHDFKLAVALNDLGGIAYNRFSNKYSYSSNLNSGITVKNNILDPFHATNQNAFDSIGANVFGQMGSTKTTGFGTWLPAAANIQMDFRISKHIYTSVFWNQSLKGRNSTGLRSTSMFSVVPRVESRGFEFSLPLTLSENYRNFYVGAYTRIGPVFFGTDNLGGLLNVASNSQYTGADIYGGVSFGIGHCFTSEEKHLVDPVYTDSTDSVKIVKRDTLVKHDTLRIVKHDTLIIEKTVTSKTLADKEKELKQKELDLNRKKAELDAREKEIANKEITGTNVDVNKCKDQNLILIKENTALKDKNKVQNDAIINANKRIAELEQELKKCKTSEPYKTTNEAVMQRKIDSLTSVLVLTKIDYENCKKNTGNKTTNEAILQKRIDSLNTIIVLTKADYEKCKKNGVQNNAELLKKYENDKNKAENDAKVANRRADSLYNILLLRNQELDRCKKTSTMTENEAVKKAETDRAKAENDARVARKQADSLKVILIQKETDLLNCKKNSVQTDANVVKKLESDKAKAENDAKVARRQADSLTVLLGQKVTELDNCKKNSTQNNAEVVKKLENDKAKAENDAKVARRQADSLNAVVIKLNSDLDNCKKSSSNSTDAQKLKQCEDNNALLKAEMGEMTKTINRLNTKNYELSNRVDSLSNALKNCCKNCGTGSNDNNDDLLKKCQESNTALNLQITQLKATIAARDKSLDSAKAVNSALVQRKTELEAQINKLNADISDLKSKNTDCSDLQKQLDAKTAEAAKLKSDNTALQNQINTLNAQLNEYKTEYQFMVKQNQKCNAQLDSCKRGLYNTEPSNGGNGGSNGGPVPPSDHGSNGTNNDDVYGSTVPPSNDSNQTSNNARKLKGLEIGAQILGVLLEGSTNSGTSGNGRGNTGSTSGNQTTTNSGSTSKGKNTTESTGSANNNGGNSGGNSGSTTTTGKSTSTGSAGNSGSSSNAGNATTTRSGSSGSSNSGTNTGSAGTNSGSSASGAGVSKSTTGAAR